MKENKSFVPVSHGDEGKQILRRREPRRRRKTNPLSLCSTVTKENKSFIAVRHGDEGKQILRRREPRRRRKTNPLLL